MINFPEFDLDEALAGKAVAMRTPTGGHVRAFLSRARTRPGFIFENPQEVGFLYEARLKTEITGMWPFEVSL